MMLTLLQADHPVDLRNVIHDYFNRSMTDPGTMKEIILGVAAVLIFLVILHILLYYEKRESSPRQLRDSKKLYSEVLHHLPLSRAQRGALTDMAQQLRLPCPTHILLSPGLFSEASRQWLSLGPAAQASAHLQAITSILFPQATEPLPKN